MAVAAPSLAGLIIRTFRIANADNRRTSIVSLLFR